MTADHRPEANSAAPEGGTLGSASRRRLFKGVAGGTGVLLSVHARTALGSGTCESPSRRISGNQSPRTGVIGVTCHPGNHPNHWCAPGVDPGFTHWPASCTKPSLKTTTKNVLVWASVKPTGYRNIALADMAGEGLMLSEVLPGAPSVGLWRAMACETPLVGSNRTLLAYLCAAWINGQRYTDASARFPITALEIKRMAEASLSGAFYCPSSINMGNCGATLQWAPAQVLSYLQSLMGTGGVSAAYVPNGTNGLTA